MTEQYDAIIIGGGHNGLVTAAYLAKVGKKVLVLEQRGTLGGVAATEEIFPGYRINTGSQDAGLFLPEIVDELNLANHGLEFVESPVAVFAPQPDGTALTLWRDVEKNVAEIARFSKTDADKFPEFVKFMHRVAEVLKKIRALTPPEIKGTHLSGYLPWLKTALDLKRLGKQDMMELLRILPMSVKEFLDDWFESDALKGALGAAGITGSMQGPMAAGTAFVMLHHYLGGANGGFKSSKFVHGGIGQLSQALAACASANSAEIRTDSEVGKINLNKGKAAGVTLASGDELSAKIVISNADPRRTFFGLVGAPNLGPQFVRRVKNIRFRGATAKMNIALDGLPDLMGADNIDQIKGHIILCPGLEYLERAYDDAKYGHYSRQPYLDMTIPTLLDASLAPEGKHIISITMQYAPYHLRDTDWDDQREKLGDTMIQTLAECIPDLKKQILHRQVLTPLDFERDYGLTEGSIFHGQMGLDQLLFMRPTPGWGQYRTPIDDLYLCGAGTHPGGGVTGACGYNAAREVLKKLKGK